MVKMKKLTDLAQIDLGISVNNAEESTSFIDDTSSDSKSSGGSSSSGDFFLDYRSLAGKDKLPAVVSKSTNQETQAVQFDNAQEAVTFGGGPFSVNEFVAPSVETTARFHCEHKGLFRRFRDQLEICALWCCFCCR